MRSIHDWFAAYGESHQNPVNKAFHWVCIPVIFLSIVGLLWAIPSPVATPHVWAWAAVGFVALFYARLSKPMMLAMVAWCLLCCGLVSLMERWLPLPLWTACLILFTGGWTGQFIGHHIEGRKPSFFQDLQFLLIGPAWLMADLFRRAGLRY